ncbi:hypothetical protein CY35_04G153200 [Sphagnum magellanicum]|nr:hypothetical protein CY35_04G153200 [Sphagnum magellanicum]
MPQLLLPSNPEILQRIDRSSDLGRVSSRAPQLTLPTPWCNDDKEHGEQTAKEPTVNGPECFIVPGKETLDGSDLPRQRLITQGRRNLIHDRNNLIRLDDTTLSSTNTIIQEYKFRQYEKCTSNSKIISITIFDDLISLLLLHSLLKEYQLFRKLLTENDLLPPFTNLEFKLLMKLCKSRWT